MQITKIDGYKSLVNNLKENNKAWLLLYKEENEVSRCAIENLSAIDPKAENICIMSANVSEVRDIHEVLGIKTVPTLVQFENEKVKNIVKGCSSVDYYKNLLEESTFFQATVDGKEKQAKRVTVYSTPTCSWCNTLKTHLRNHNIRFAEIDVSKDQAAAQAMVAKSGQQGVPQTDINGEMIIGFDKNRINKLLEIQG